jgi:hypothetical protein
MEFEVPEALRSVLVRKLFGVEVLEALGGVGSGVLGAEVFGALRGAGR